MLRQQRLPSLTRVPFPQYDRIYGFNSGAAANYHAMLLSAEKRFGGGLSFKGSYTWAKALTMNGGRTAAGNIGQIQNPLNFKDEKGVTVDNIKQRFVNSLVYELPWGKGKALGSNMNAIADKILGGWTVSAITTFRSGFLARSAGEQRQQLQLSQQQFLPAGSESAIRTWTATVWIPQCSTSMPSTGLGRRRRSRQSALWNRRREHSGGQWHQHLGYGPAEKHRLGRSDTGFSSAGSCSMPSIMRASANLAPTRTQPLPSAV